MTPRPPQKPVPYMVEMMPEWHGGWLDLNGIWITRNVLVPGEDLGQVRTAHLRPDGADCHGNGAGLGLHTLVSRDPLTLSPSLRCPIECGWHGFVTFGRWDAV